MIHEIISPVIISMLRDIPKYHGLRTLENLSWPLCLPNPRKCLIATLFNDFEIPHLNTGYSEIGNFELDCDRWPSFNILLFRSNM
jgi:hypothetical protein